MYTISRSNEEEAPHEWVTLCAQSDVRPGQSRVFEIDGKSLLLCHSANGFALVANLCSHKALPLDGGRLIGNEIICPHHGARFCLADGRAMAGAIRPLKTYDVEVADSEVRALLPVRRGDSAPE